MRLNKSGVKGVLLILLFFMLDYFTKLYIVKFIPSYSSVEVIPGFFNIVHVNNSGIAFGVFAHLPDPYRIILLGGVSAIVFLIVVYLVFFGKDKSLLFIVSIALLGGGDLGNLYERVFKGYVVDFLDFHIGKYHYPAFNLADSFITIGIFLLIIYKLLDRRIRNV